MKFVYLDNAAATPIDSRVLKTMVAAYKKYGNPSSFNNAGRSARQDIELSRTAVARFLGARAEEIVFTSSGSEANSLAILGLAQTFYKKGSVALSTIEHPSVLESASMLATWGWKIHRLAVNKEGFVDVEDLKNRLVKNRDIRLVSIMYVNNEIGTIEPIRKISKLISDHNRTYNTSVLFHVDACQATGYLDMNVQHLGVDLMSFNGSKIYGPRGIGVLYIRRGIKLQPLIHGGSQERGLRAGTENSPAIIGLAKALSVIKPTEAKKIAALRDYAIKQLEEKISGVKINGPYGPNRLANNINISVFGLQGEVLLLELDRYGIAAGSGSACTSHAVEPSHVLKAIGVPKSYINGALRFSLGRDTTKRDIDYLVQTLIKIILDLKKRYSRLR